MNRHYSFACFFLNCNHDSRLGNPSWLVFITIGFIPVCGCVWAIEVCSRCCYELGLGDASTWSRRKASTMIESFMKWINARANSKQNGSLTINKKLEAGEDGARRNDFSYLLSFLFSSSFHVDNAARMCLKQTNLICDLIKVVQNTNMHKECYSITFTEKKSKTRERLSWRGEERSLCFLFLQHDKLRRSWVEV